MNSAIGSFLEYLKFEKRASVHTVRSYGDDLQNFSASMQNQFGETPLHALSSGFIRSWLVELKEAGLTARSINRKISTLKSFFRFCLRRGLIDSLPTDQLILPKMSSRLPAYVEQKEMKSLFSHLEFPDSWEGKTDRLLIAVFYQTGMRLQELINLKEAHVDKGRRAIKVLGKGNKERIIPVQQELCLELAAYAKEKRKQFEKADGVYLFVTGKGNKLYPKYAYRAVTGYLQKITTADKKSPHVLRHSFATHLMNNGADLNSVKELLGHASLAATQVYTHNTIEKLKDIHRKAHPKA